MLKQMWTTFNELRNKSGFGWNNDDKSFSADDSVWDALIEAKPKCAQFRNAPLADYELLDILFNDSVATGDASRSAADAFSTDESHEEDSEDSDDELVANQTPAKKQRSSLVPAIPSMPPVTETSSSSNTTPRTGGRQSVGRDLVNIARQIVSQGENSTVSSSTSASQPTSASASSKPPANTVALATNLLRTQYKNILNVCQYRSAYQLLNTEVHARSGTTVGSGKRTKRLYSGPSDRVIVMRYRWIVSPDL